MLRVLGLVEPRRPRAARHLLPVRRAVHRRRHARSRAAFGGARHAAGTRSSPRRSRTTDRGSSLPDPLSWIFPVFRRFEVTTTVVKAEPGILLRPGVVDFAVANPRAVLGSFVGNHLTAHVVAATAFVDPGEERNRAAASRTSAVADHLSANTSPHASIPRPHRPDRESGCAARPVRGAGHRAGTRRGARRVTWSEPGERAGVVACAGQERRDPRTARGAGELAGGVEGRRRRQAGRWYLRHDRERRVAQPVDDDPQRPDLHGYARGGGRGHLRAGRCPPGRRVPAPTLP